jgi:hypothetical protein
MKKITKKRSVKLQTEIDSLLHFPACVVEATGVANGEMELRRILAENDAGTLAIIKAKDAEIESKQSKLATEERKRSEALDRIKSLDVKSISDPILKDIVTVIK